MLTKKEQRLRRSRQTRIRIATQGVARLTVNRTNLHIYASVISGDGSKILAAASTAEVEVRKDLGASGKGGNVAAAQAIGKRIAEKAKAAGVEKVAFDFEFFDSQSGGAACAARWDQEIACVAVFDFDDVTQIAQVDNFVEQNNLHACAPYRLRCWSL